MIVVLARDRSARHYAGCAGERNGGAVGVKRAKIERRDRPA